MTYLDLLGTLHSLRGTEGVIGERRSSKGGSSQIETWPSFLESKHRFDQSLERINECKTK